MKRKFLIDLFNKFDNFRSLRSCRGSAAQTPSLDTVMTARRDLDLGTLRSFVTIAEVGSMTRAANRLHMTQSAVSMQMKRLEDSLDMILFERNSRGMAPTASGDQLLRYANQMLSLNDEAWNKMTSPDYEGHVSLGVPVDIITPFIPNVLRAFNLSFPRVKVSLKSSRTLDLLDEFQRGVHDIVLTTEVHPGEHGEILSKQKVVWTGAPKGEAWRQRPLPISFSKSCFFRSQTIDQLTASGITWRDLIETDDDLAGLAMVAADLSVTAELEGAVSQSSGPIPEREIINHGGELPELPEHAIVMYLGGGANRDLTEKLAEFLATEYC